MTERQQDQAWIEQQRALYLARADRVGVEE